MSNAVNIAGSANASTVGSPSNFSFSAQAPFTGNHAPLLQQTITTTPTLLALGGAATVLALLLKVLTGSGTQHVYLGLDNAYPPAHMVGDIPEALGTILIRPCAAQPAQIYASVNTGTIVVEYKVIEQ